MPKKKSRSVSKNGLARRDSVFLTPVDEDSDHGYPPGGVFGTALSKQDGYEFYSGPLQAPGGSEPDESEAAFQKRGVGLDFAILDSTFLLSQVFPTLFMGSVVQLAQSVTAYIVFSAVFGAIAIYLAGHVVFDQKDLKS